MHKAWNYVSLPPVYESPAKASKSNGASIHPARRSASLHLLWKTDTREREKEEVHSDLQG